MAPIGSQGPNTRRTGSPSRSRGATSVRRRLGRAQRSGPAIAAAVLALLLPSIAAEAPERAAAQTEMGLATPARMSSLSTIRDDGRPESAARCSARWLADRGVGLDSASGASPHTSAESPSDFERPPGAVMRPGVLQAEGPTRPDAARVDGPAPESGIPTAPSAADEPLQDDIGPIVRPNDTYFSLHGRAIHVAMQSIKAWRYTFGARDTTIAVISDGVDYTHGDLDAKIWRNADEILGNGIDDDRNGYVDDWFGWDFAGDLVVAGSGVGPVPDNDPMPLQLGERSDSALGLPVSRANRGTMMAGLAAAETHNAYGIAGLAWGAKIMPLKIALEYEFEAGDESSRFVGAYPVHIVEAICYAANNGADVILFGGFALPDPRRDWETMVMMEGAIEHAHEMGALVIAPAGECGTPGPGCPDEAEYGPDPTILPAGFQRVLAVQSVDLDLKRRERASSGPWVDLVAPGEGFMTTVNTENDFEFTIVGNRHPDTSDFAAANVAGVAALLLAADPDLTPYQLETQLCASASRTVGGPYSATEGRLRNDRFGCGAVDAEAGIELMRWQVSLDIDAMTHTVERSDPLPNIRLSTDRLNRGAWEIRRDVGWIRALPMVQPLGMPSEISIALDLARLEAEELSGRRLAAGDEVTTSLRVCPVNPRNVFFDDERDCLPGSRSGCHCIDYLVRFVDELFFRYLPSLSVGG